MKKFLALLLALTMVVGLCACGAKPAEAPAAPAAPAADGKTEAAPAPAELPTYDIKLGTFFAAAQGGGELALKIADAVKEASDGRINITVYNDSTLGSQTELAEAVRIGTVDMCINEWSAMATNNGFAAGMITNFPFLFDSWEHYRAFIASDYMQKDLIQNLYDEQGIVVLGCSADGFRKIYTQIPIESIEDFAKLKIRIPDIAIYNAFATALGAAPTIVAAAELYTSLQNGIVNALERPADGMYSNKLQEQTKYVVKTDHIFCEISVFMFGKLFDSMDAEAQEILRTTVSKVCDEHIDYMKGRDVKALEALGETQTILEVDRDALKAVMQEKVWPEFAKNIPDGEAMVKGIQELKY